LPRPFFAIRFPQQEILQDKFVIAGSKRRTANQAFEFAVAGFWSDFGFDNLIKRVAVGALKNGFLMGLAMVGPSGLYAIRFCASEPTSIVGQQT
jgi:hypothetical protein